MKILMFSWKDIQNPAAGGAEVMSWEILRGLVDRGHQVTLFTSRYLLSQASYEIINGVQIYRAGGRFGVYLWAVYYYFRFFRNQVDLVIDQANTLPFFTPLFVKEKKIAFFPQLARVLWFYETRFPISVIGYLLEPIIVFLYRDQEVVTISPSSKKDLERFGIKKIRIVPVVSGIRPVLHLPDPPSSFNIGFVGRLVPGKRALAAVEAFAHIKGRIPSTKLFLVGRGAPKYQKTLEKRIQELNLGPQVIIIRNASQEQRDEVLSQLKLLLVTSVKEGWGLVVIEANSRGVPAVVYNVDGLRDSVLDGRTGLICSQNNPKELARLVLRIYSEPALYESLRNNAWEFSKSFTKDKTVNEFLKIIDPG